MTLELVAWKLSIKWYVYNRKSCSQVHEFLQIYYGDNREGNRNLQILATKIYKTKNDLSSLIVRELFEQRYEQHYDLRKNSQFTIPPVRTVHHGSEGISFLWPKIWSILPDRLKNANSTEAFKMQLKKWKPENCSCRLCKVYVHEYFYKRKRTKAFKWNMSFWFYETLILWFYDVMHLFFKFMFNLQIFIFSTFGSWCLLACLYT